MLERLVIAAVGVVVLIAAAYVARVAWAQYRRRVVRTLRADGVWSDGARVLYFSTPYCVTCKEMQEPALERLAALAPRVAIERVDAVERADLAERYRVMTVPSTAVFDSSGSLVEINYGYAPLARLAQQLGIELPESATARYEI